MSNSPTSIREQLLQAVVTTLMPIAREMRATLLRSPVVPTLRDQTPAVLVFPEEERVDAQNSIAIRHLTVRIVALAREVDRNVGEVVADQLTVAVHAALMANNNLGGRCLKIRELGSEWDMEDADATAVAIPARYQIEYRTRLNDLTVKA
jgi:hypothetical protein